MCSAEKPSEAERDSYGHIGLVFDGVAQCLLKGTGRLPCGIGSGIDDLRGGIRYFICDASGLLFGISHGAVEISGRSLRHVACSARIGVVWCQRANVSESSLPGTFVPLSDCPASVSEKGCYDQRTEATRAGNRASC